MRNHISLVSLVVSLLVPLALSNESARAATGTERSIPSGTPAVDSAIARHADLDLRIEQARSRQEAVARDSEIEVEIVRRPQFVRGGIEGVPPAMRGRIIHDSRDIEDYRDLLGAYLGFIGSEELVFAGETDFGSHIRYSFGQKINGIELDNHHAILVLVDKETRTITKVAGGVFLDMGYRTRPSMSEREAIETALAARENRGKYFSSNHRGHRTRRIYLTEDNELVLVWLVGLKLKHPQESSTAYPHDYFHVHPDGSVDDRTILVPSCC